MKTKSLKAKIIVILLLFAIVPALTLSSFFIFYERHTLVEQQNELASVSIQLLLSSVENKADSNISDIANVINTQDASNHKIGSYVICDTDGTIVVDELNNSYVNKNIDEVYGKETSDGVLSQTEYKLYKTSNGYYYIKSVKNDKLGIICTMFCDKSVISEKLGKVCLQVLAFGIIHLILTILASSYIGKRYTSPVIKMTEIATSIAYGNFDVNVNMNIKENNEMKQLVDAFKEISMTLKLYERHIDEISSILDKISIGDMTFTLDEEYTGEFNKIKKSLIHISENLTQTMRKIKDSSEQLANSSIQVSNGSEQLSQGATEQASSIEELSASISDILVSVNANTENAIKASEVVENTGDAMKESCNRIDSMLKAMDKISDTSNEISNIIKTIDNIAFQTNILALNAAVEASRAGEAGRGFSVVAEEVRNLAQRSAEAANSTTELISKSLEAIENGSQIAKDTSEYVNAVLTQSSKVMDLVDNIAEASKEQVNSISQINSGVEQISGIVQVNSATSEESAAASEQLSVLAQSLKDEVEKFRLN